jgi:recombination endonuclease VII
MPRGKKHERFVRSFTGELYDELLEAQGGHCALCPATPKTRRLNLDHDHATMRVRGLLCHRCNRPLFDYVTPEWLRRAADYLERSIDKP